MYLFKKLVGPLLFPLPIALVLLTAGVLLLWFGRRQRAGKIVVTAGLVWLALFSFRPVPHALLGGLERTYATFDPATPGAAGVRWVVVLDGGGSRDTTISVPARVSRPTIGRLVEGIRILQFYPEARLLLAGATFSTGPFDAQPPPAFTTADLMAQTAVLLGVDPARIVTEAESRDTETQAVNVGRMVGDAPFVLVTSAWHLRRATALFRKQGLHPLPAPADFLVKRSRFDPTAAYPEADYLEKATVWFYETIGYVWVWLNGRV